MFSYGVRAFLNASDTSKSKRLTYERSNNLSFSFFRWPSCIGDCIPASFVCTPCSLTHWQQHYLVLVLFPFLFLPAFSLSQGSCRRYRFSDFFTGVSAFSLLRRCCWDSCIIELYKPTPESVKWQLCNHLVFLNHLRARNLNLGSQLLHEVRFKRINGLNLLACTWKRRGI